MSIDWMDLHDGDLHGIATIYDNEIPVVEFEMYKGLYVADWNSCLPQNVFLNSLMNIGCSAHDISVYQVIDKQEKSQGQIYQAFNNEIVFWAIDKKDYSITWYKTEENRFKIEFSSDYSNFETLLVFFDMTSENKMVTRSDFNVIYEKYTQALPSHSTFSNLTI